MKRIKKHTTKGFRRAQRTRSRLQGSPAHPRLSVFRSNRYLWAQVIDDTRGATIASASDRDIASGTSKKGAQRLSRRERAEKVGERLAEKAKEKNIREVRFDRGRFRYHGLVAALAAGARKGGLTF